MVYGFFQSSFATEGRYGGFRPVVFFPNGLVLALFTAVAVMAAVALWRSRAPVLGLAKALPAAYLTTLLVLCKSLGALVIGVTSTALIQFGRPQFQLRVAVLLVTVVLAYPTLRTLDLFPTSTLLGWAAMVNEDRAGSLKTRFDHVEDALLDRASERLWVGLGPVWSRPRL